MAIRWNLGAGNRYKRTGGTIPARTSFTASVWFRILTLTSGGSDLNTLFRLADSGGGTMYVLCESGGKIKVYDGSHNAGTSTISMAVWYHAAITGSNNAGNADLLGYLNGVAEASKATATTFTPAQFTVGDSETNDPLSGDIAALKIWNAALSAAEVQREMWTYLPQRTDNIIGFYPFLNPTEGVTDYSQQQNFTNIATAPTYIDGPPIAWGSRRRSVIFVGSGGTPVSASSSSAYESTALVAKAAAAPSESAAPVSAARASALEWRRLLASSNQSASEAIARAAQAAVAPLELTGRVAGTVAAPSESNRTIAGTIAAPHELTGRVVASVIAADEWVAPVTKTAQSPSESTGRVAASPASPWESSGQALVSSSQVSPWESAAGLAAARGSAHEWKSPASASSSSGTESMASVSRSAQAPLEFTRGLVIAVVAPWESSGLQIVTASRVSSWESLGRVAKAVVAPDENMGRLVASQLAAWESVRPASASSASAHESILGVTKAATSATAWLGRVTRAIASAWESLLNPEAHVGPQFALRPGVGLELARDVFVELLDAPATAVNVTPAAGAAHLSPTASVTVRDRARD